MAVFTNLIKLLDEKMEVLNQQMDEDINSIHRIQSEIKTISGIVRMLEENPLNLYTMSDEMVTDIISSLSLDNDTMKTFETYRVIHECYNRYGKEYVPQFKSIEEYASFIHEQLKEKEKKLPDEVTPHQLSVISDKEKYQLYETLQSELSTPFVVIETSSIELINELLKEMNITEQEKLEIKLEINAKNAYIYKTLLDELNKEEASVEIEPEEFITPTELTELEDSLKKNFKEEELKNLRTLSDLLTNCEDEETFDKLIEEWKYVWGDLPLSDVIDGLIQLKLIDKLVIASLDLSEEEKNKEFDKIEQHIDYLNMHIDKLLDEDDYSESEPSLDTYDNKISQALNERKTGLLDTPNCVICLSDNIERDIENIYDKQTLEDAFLLIEQLRNDKVESAKKLDHGDPKLSGLFSLKPTSKGRQARVVYIKIANNMYGIINITGKKKDNPTSWVKTMKSRRSSIDIEKLSEDLKNPDVFEEYENRTLRTYNTLINKIAPQGKELTGGAK